MKEMISLSINIHFFMIILLLLVALYNIYLTKSIKNEVLFINKIKYTLPIYMGIIIGIIFTGVLVMAVNHFNLKASLILMILAILWIFINSIKQHVVRKSSNTNNIQSMKHLRSFVVKKYLLDIFVMIAISVVSYFLR